MSFELNKRNTQQFLTIPTKTEITGFWVTFVLEVKDQKKKKSKNLLEVHNIRYVGRQPLFS